MDQFKSPFRKDAFTPAYKPELWIDGVNIFRISDPAELALILFKKKQEGDKAQTEYNIRASKVFELRQALVNAEKAEADASYTLDRLILEAVKIEKQLATLLKTS